MADKTNTFKDIEQAMIDLNLEMIEEYRKGYINENKLKAAEIIVKTYEALKPQTVSKTK